MVWNPDRLPVPTQTQLLPVWTKLEDYHFGMQTMSQIKHSQFSKLIRFSVKRPFIDNNEIKVMERIASF
jgi:hypothetical protein